jgi:signal transduction histidine kinase
MSVADATGDLVLVVDDTEASRYRTSRILRRSGFEVIEAACGEDAIALARERNPRLMILDINLPDIDGWEVCRRIKADPATAAVLVLQLSASYVSEADTARSLDGGADGCLTEPVEPVVLVATVRALLRVRRAEEDLRAALGREQAAREAAETANHAKDRFLAVLSHELRSPLQGVVGWSHLLRQGRLDAAASKHALDVIDRSLRQQVALVNDLLDVSRIIAGKLSMSRRAVDARNIVRAALEEHQLAAEAKRVRIEHQSSIAGDDATILGDRERLQQVVANLVGNAVKFTPEGGCVTVELRREGPEVVIVVRDTGEGIDAGLLPHVFDPFRQAATSNRRPQGGLGLGLALVRSIVDMHGGSVSAESAGRGQGASFVVRLPAVAMVAERDVVDDRVPASATLEGVRVLIVEDDPDARSALRVVLELAGAQACIAESSAEAIATIAREPIDVLLSDISMPDEDGYTLVSKIRALEVSGGRRLVTVALTGHASEGDRARALSAGFDAHVGKPVEPAMLVASVASLVADLALAQ